MEEEKETCPRCDGSGLCIECEGKGVITCPDCEGDKSFFCKKCNGKGEIPCSPKCEVCDGKGYIDYSSKSQNESVYQDKRDVITIQIIPQKPVATFVLLILCVLYTIFSGALFEKGNILFYLGVFIPSYVMDGEWWRFITSMFLHANFLHLASNMYFLYVTGPIIEQLLGVKKYLYLYFISGIVGSIVSMIVMPDVPSVGASGALFGVFASYFALHAKFHCFPPRMINNLYFWLGINIVLGLAMPRVNMCAHIGGFVAGFIYMYFFSNIKDNLLKR